MYTYDSTFEELDAAVLRTVGYVRTPDIDFKRDMGLEWLFSGDLAEWEQAPYLKLYDEIIRPYFTYGGINPIAGCEKTFGFNAREINHPVLNVMMLNIQPYHYTFMKPCIKKARREVEREERARSQKYSDAVYFTRVHDKAIALRKVELKSRSDQSYNRRLAQIDASTDAYERELYANARSGDVVDYVRDLPHNHPFLTGFFGTMLYLKIKDFFAK